MSKIIDILHQYNVEYRDSGKNVKAGNINICCPLCSDDTGFHMGIEPEKGWYGCWRSPKHRGKNFAWVLKSLAGCSLEEAIRLTGGKPLLEENEFDKLAKNLWQDEEEEEIKRVETLEFHPSFRSLNQTRRSSIVTRFRNYIYDRGFSEDLTEIVRYYKLKFCLTGNWGQRIIFPIYFDGKLITWVGRSITPSTIPYMDLSFEESVMPPKHCLWNYDQFSKGGEVLYITEGLFDALKVDAYSKPGHFATCLLTKTMTSEQMVLLMEVAPRFQEIRILLDTEAWGIALDLAGELDFLGNIRVMSLPAGVEDPGDLSIDQVKQLM
ncbi:MAG: hypothetical protein KAR06_00455 [Deltaproteobacteria bacterium]|nr:hypothetical protein [Deltaproteobacteria bacterium]